MSNIEQVSLQSGEYAIVGLKNSFCVRAGLHIRGGNCLILWYHYEKGAWNVDLPSGYKYSSPIIVSQATEEQAAEIVGKYRQIAVDSLKRICQQELPDYQDWVIIKQEKL